MNAGNLNSPLMHAATEQPAPHHAAAPMNDHEVKVWVRDVNGAMYFVKTPISSTFAEVMQKVGEQHGRGGFFQGIYVGFEGGRELVNGRMVTYVLLSRKCCQSQDLEISTRSNTYTIIQFNRSLRCIESKAKHLWFSNECIV
jgi:hypothetical protein